MPESRFGSEENVGAVQLKQITRTARNRRLRIISGQVEPRMKRALFGLIWFFAFSISGLVAVGGVAGSMAARTTKATNFSDGFRDGNSVGKDAGGKYGTVVILGALVLSVVGAAARILPGTRRRTS
jgi:hypothetical protein